MTLRQNEEKSQFFLVYTHEPLYHVVQPKIQALQSHVTPELLCLGLFDIPLYLLSHLLQTKI